MKTLILAAGPGTRLASLTNGRPKVLMPVCGVPMLERLLSGLGRGGVAQSIAAIAARRCRSGCAGASGEGGDNKHAQGVGHSEITVGLPKTTI